MNATDLSARLAELLSKERGALADFLIALAEFDARRLWLDLGYPSLWMYLTRHLRLTSASAQYRKTGCALVQEFPEIIEPLRAGRLCFSTVVELAKAGLTRDNVAEVLPRYFGLSKREAMAVTAELRPVEHPPRPTVVSTIARPSPDQPVAAPERPAEAIPLPPDEAFGTSAQELPILPRAEVVPLSAELRRIHMNASRRFMDKVDAARDALSHSNPRASLEEIFEVGLDLILDLACRAHNQRSARLTFGNAWMDRFARKPQRCATTSATSPRTRSGA